MENMTVYSVLALLPDTQIQINDFINQLLIPIENGNGEPMKVWVKLRKVELLIEQAKEKIKSFAEKEAYYYDNQIIDGFQVNFVPVKTEYDYSNCNDSIWQEIDEKIFHLERAKKERENFLKRITPNYINIDTGEVLNPPVKTQKNGIKLTLKNK